MTADEREAVLYGRKNWPAGPWDSEPDRVEFRHAGLPCLLIRGPMGNWCGYTAVPPGHPWHGKPYDETPADVHGGLTYAGPCRGHICHVPLKGEPDDVWWLGFDCAHAVDLTPGLLVTRLRLHEKEPEVFGSMTEWETYRDVEYVRHETELLAEQAVRA